MVGDDYINGLSLCAGVGGLDLALELAFPGYRTIAAVENNPEAARRFRLRFPKAKVFRDVVGFDGRPLRDRVGAVAAGWPCQPHSVAGKRLGTADERWIWGDVARILAETDAPLFFGENVSGLLRDTDSPANPGQEELDGAAEELIGGMGTVLRDLAEMGRVTIWGLLRAASVGASHGRPRIFLISVKPRVLLEHASDTQRGSGIGRAQAGIGTGGIGWRGSSGASASVGQAHAPSGGLRIDRRAPGPYGHAEQRDTAMADPCGGLLPLPGWRPQGRNGTGSAGKVLADAEREPGSAKQFADAGERPDCGALDGSVLGHPRVGQADACEPGPPRPQRPELPGAQPEHKGRTTEQLCGALPECRVEDSTRPATAAGRSGRRRGVRGAGDYLDAFGLFAPGPSDPLWIDVLAARPDLAPALSPVTKLLAEALLEGWDFREWEVAAGADVSEEAQRRFHGLAARTRAWLHERRVRLQCDGNLVVSVQAACCFTVLARRLGLTLAPISDNRTPK